MQISEGLRKIRLVKGTFQNQQVEDKRKPTEDALLRTAPSLFWFKGFKVKLPNT